MTSSNFFKKEKRDKIIDSVRALWYKTEPVMRYLLPLLIAAVGVGTVLYYILGPSKYYMTGDSTDSIRWAQATFESGLLISEDFAYAAILPFGGNLIFLPFLELFGYSVKAQVYGLATFALLFAFALYYMSRGLGFNRYASAGLVSTVFIIMSSGAKLREIMWEHIFYYNLGLLFFCIGVGLTARILKNDGEILRPRTVGKTAASWISFALVCAVSLAIASWGLSSVTKLCIATAIVAFGIFAAIAFSSFRFKKTGFTVGWSRLLLLSVFSMLAATDGLQTLVCFTLPIAAGVLCDRIFDHETKIFSAKNAKVFGVVVALGISSVMGYKLIEKVTGGVTAGYADAYSSYSAMSSWTNNFLGFMKNWFSLLGVSVANGDELVSRESIINMIRIFGGLILLAAPIILLCFWKKIKRRGVRIALIGHFAVSAFILFAVTFGKLGGANWRLTPMLGTSVIVSFIAAIEFIRMHGVLVKRFGILLLAVLMVIAFPAYSEIDDMESNTGDNVAWHMATAELKARGLKYGYANFWFAESITLFSDGELEVANIAEGYEVPVKYMYQVPRDSYADKEDDDAGYFLLLTEAENLKMTKWLRQQHTNDAVKEEFTISTSGYNLRGHVGTEFYVYVFYENIFK